MQYIFLAFVDFYFVLWKNSLFISRQQKWTLSPFTKCSTKYLPFLQLRIWCDIYSISACVFMKKWLFFCPSTDKLSSLLMPRIEYCAPIIIFTQNFNSYLLLIIYFFQISFYYYVLFTLLTIVCVTIERFFLSYVVFEQFRSSINANTQQKRLSCVSNANENENRTHEPLEN